MKTLIPTSAVESTILSIEIAKVPLCLLIGFTTFFGNIYSAHHLDSQPFASSFSVFLLACGAASLNSLQERYDDRLMARTRKRPLVQGDISNRHALIQAGILISSGLLGLLYFTNIWAFIAGLAGVFIYNFVYTTLKTMSIYALIPGALCGAIPPYIGWLAAGGEFFSFTMVLPPALLFFWQIPHFLLILLRHKSDYIQSISPNLLRYLSESALHRIFLPWITALVTTMITFSVMPSAIGAVGRGLIVANALIILVVFYYHMLWSKKYNYRILFMFMNTSLVVHMAIIITFNLQYAA